jgi:hypothetical protein
MRFLRRAASDPIAHTVKLADIADNADETRLALLEPAEAARLRSKYEQARSVLARQEQPATDSVRRLQEAEYAEIGIPSGEAAACTTFWCAHCGRPAGTVEVIGHDVVVAAFSVGWLCPSLTTTSTTCAGSSRMVMSRR